MAGRGFAPKDPEKRARRNADPIGRTVLEFIPGEQPELPQLVHDDPDVGRVIEEWHPQTVEWWGMWQEAAQSDSFTATDWSFLIDTALIHHRFWSGDMKAAAELRLRVTKFGVTPEDRARLRMVFADADEKDAKRTGTVSSPRPAGAYGGLRAVQGGHES
jgi:hypothetical protein